MRDPGFTGLVETGFLQRQSCDEYSNLFLPDTRYLRWRVWRIGRHQSGHSAVPAIGRGCV